MTKLLRWTMAASLTMGTGAFLPTLASADAPPAPSTPKELVASYDALADTILGSHKAERKLVLAILATTYGHAQAEAARVHQALKAKDTAAAGAAIDNVATAVGQIGTEGDNAVAGVRKRLLEGGHHANSEGEAQGLYEEGYVIVSKAAKKEFLASSQALAMLAKNAKSDPEGTAFDAEWKKVEAAWTKNIASAK